MQIDIIWFDDVSPLNEPVLSFPILGKVSMRQFFILGVTAMISYMVFTSLQTYFALIPAFLGIGFAMTKPKVTSSERMALSMIMFALGNRTYTVRKIKKPKTKSTKVKTSSKKMGLAETLIEETHTQEIRKIIVSDLSHPYRLKVKIIDPQGKILKNQKTQVFIDGNYQDALTTDPNGMLETIIVPGTVGLKKITIYAKGQELPIYSEQIEIENARQARTL